MMSPEWTFFFGLLLLILFGWYFATDQAARKRAIGVVLTVLLVTFCLEQLIPPKDRIALGLDLQGGTSFLIRLVPDDDRPITSDMQEQAVEVIRSRVDQYGVGDPMIAPVGPDELRVEIPGLDTEKLRETEEQLQRVAKLEFKIVEGGEAAIQQIEAGEAILPPSLEIREYIFDQDGEEQTTRLLLQKRPVLTGEYVREAHAYFDQRGYGVAVTFDSKGGELFGDLTEANVNKQMAILLDGEIQSAPNINEPIYGGRATITGNFTDAEARELASVLENPLQTPVVIEETRSTSATLGADSIRSGIYAGLLGLVFVVVFVLLYYHVAGLVALFGLTVNIVILFGAMAMFNFVLTLPGIAGIILTIGMAIDANVLIFERLREELSAGKSLSAAVKGAYDKAFSAIFDANVTTLITSVILFWQATGPVQGFAVTLTLGILASLFSSLLVTRTAFSYLTDSFGLKKLTMLNFIPQQTFDFLGKRKFAMVVSVILIGGSIAIVGVRGPAVLGIDFKGGDLLGVYYENPITVQEARDALAGVGMEDVVIQKEIAAEKEMIAFRAPAGTSDQILAALGEAFPDAGLEIAMNEKVGAQIGGEFAKRALIALGLGMLGILIYVTIRFEFGFALGAVVAVVHDIAITLGIFALTGRELSLVMVGAILTIAGYSINDTIVVFDRIREALKSGQRGSIVELMNRAINDTLGRTLLTGGTTLLSVGALLAFGGAVLNDFAFAIIIGVIVGTYSSIFIAAPIVLWWSHVRGKSIRKEVLQTEAERQSQSTA